MIFKLPISTPTYSPIKRIMTQIFLFIGLVTTLLLLSPITTPAQATEPQKEWTLLVYLNGNNNLDPYGKMNIHQMEQVGSTDQINVVVQWASLANQKTQRLYVTKNTSTDTVNSPILQDLGTVDMGDWHSLVDFVQWGVDHFPAKHYFIDVWDHGSGWHAIRNLSDITTRSFIHPMDISWDDHSGNSITTVQLGTALQNAAQIIGHQVDVYASDACLMAMPEVAQEVSPAVHIYAGSEEVEPGAGWPYHTFLAQWSAHPYSSPAQVATYLTQAYVASYTDPSAKQEDVTFSAFNLHELPKLNQSIFTLGQELTQLNSTAKKRFLTLAKKTQRFTFDDYADLGDFVRLARNSPNPDLSATAIDGVQTALKSVVIAHGASPSLSKSTGLAIWLPTSSSTYQQFASQYHQLRFDHETHWGEALKSLF